MLVTQKTPGIVSAALPQTTCHYGIHCDHKGQPEPETYRFSIERREKAMSATHPIGFRGIQNLSTVLRSPTLMGQGKGGEIWICLTCYEGVLDDKLYRKLFGDGTDPAGLHQLIQWLNFIVPETRSLPEFPGTFTLTSPQRHTVYLWVAVHQWVVYLCENPEVKKLLDNGVYVEKAFPSDLFPALNYNEALYLDTETRDFRAYTPNGNTAELRWVQVLNTKLSDSLAMSDQLVEFFESETVDVSSDESEGAYERTFGREGSHQSNSGDDEEDFTVPQTMATTPNREQAARAASNARNRHSGTPVTKIGPDNAQTFTSRAVRTSPRGQKRDYDGTPIAVNAASTHEHLHDSTPMTSSQSQEREPAGTSIVQRVAEGPEIEKDVESEREDRRIKRAKRAWDSYLQGPHCSS